KGIPPTNDPNKWIEIYLAGQQHTLQEKTFTPYGARWFQKPGSLPLDRTFLRSVDLRQFFVRTVEEPLHVVHEKALRFSAAQVEAVMVDDSRLGLQPFGP